MKKFLSVALALTAGAALAAGGDVGETAKQATNGNRCSNIECAFHLHLRCEDLRVVVYLHIPFAFDVVKSTEKHLTDKKV